MKKLYTASKAMLLLLLVSFSASAQIGFQTITATGLVDPMDIAIPPNASPANGSTRMFIAQRNGLIRRWNGTAFSDLVNIASVLSTGGERGLLSMTFHPSYDGVTNRDFFVYYTNTGGDLMVARYRTAVGDPDAIEAGSGTEIITPIEHSLRDNHNGGDINFGPDGFLYLTTGDGGGGADPDENAQNPASFLGKLLQINVNAATLPTTPVVVDIGLRNPFRWTFDRLTGDAWIGDVGQGAWEEITRKPAGTSGLNYGWDCYEGLADHEVTMDCPPLASTTIPEYTYPNPAQGQSVVGGYVYRGTEFPSLYGWYIATDYFSGRIFRRSPSGAWFMQASTGINTMVSFGEAPDGTLYSINQNGDDLFKVTVTGPLPVTLSGFSGKRNGSISELRWNTLTEQNTARFRIEYSTTASNFQQAGVVAASRNANGYHYTFQHPVNISGDLYYRLVIEDDDGSISYSSIIRLGSRSGVRIYPSLVRDNIINIQSVRPAHRMQIMNTNGAVVFQKELNGVSGTSAIPVPKFTKGMYVVQLTLEGETVREKIIIE